MGAVLDEIIAPDMVRVFRPQPDAGAIGQPEPALLRLLLWNLQTLAPPDPLDPLVIDDPAGGGAQKLGDLPIAIPAVLPDKFNDISNEIFLVISPLGTSTLR